MGLVLALAAFLIAWNNLANLVPAFETAYVGVNLAVTAGVLAVARRRGLDWPEMGLGSDRMGAGLRWGGAAFVLVALGLMAALVLPATRPWLADARIAGLGAGELAWLALVRIPLGTVVLEEVAFRGVLLGAWARRRSIREALVGQAAVFGLWHITPTWIALEAGAFAVAPLARVAVIAAAVVITGVAGVLFGWLRLRSGSVLAPALAHVGTNSLAAVAGFTALRLGS